MKMSNNSFAELPPSLIREKKAKILMKEEFDIAIEKPCKHLFICPYGILVEMFPLSEDPADPDTCYLFGHICPAFYVSSVFSEEIQKR